MNKLVEFHQVGNPEVLSISNQTIPSPGPDELIIQVKACGLNRAELLYMQGYYLFQPEFPSKIGMEAAGLIHVTGSNIQDFQVGDEVCLTPNIKMNEYGFLGEYVVVPKEAVLIKPPNISFEEAASVWVAYLTAYGGLVIKGGLQKGQQQTVVISAASSSVGIAAIQMAKHFEATVIATTRTAAKKNYLLEQGADWVIVTQEEDVVQQIQTITNGKGFDLAFDAVGGNFFTQLIAAAASNARLILYGLLSLEEPPISIFPIAMKELQIHCFHAVFNLLQQPERLLEASQHIVRGLETSVYQPIIDKTFGLEEIELAYNYMISGQQKGKILIKI